MCDGKAIEDLQGQIEALTEERDDWHGKFAALASKVTPKGVNVPASTRNKRRAANKVARASRKTNR